jgi:hypothetical protein
MQQHDGNRNIPPALRKSERQLVAKARQHDAEDQAEVQKDNGGLEDGMEPKALSPAKSTPVVSSKTSAI